MYTYYFQSLATLGGTKFILTASKSQASGVQAQRDGGARGQLYSEDSLRTLISNGYRVVIDPAPSRASQLENAWRFAEERDPAQLQIAPGFRAVYPETMFAIPRRHYQDFCSEYDAIAVERQDEVGGDFKQTVSLTREIPAAGALPPQAPLAPSYAEAAVTEFRKADGSLTTDIREATVAIRKEYLTPEEILEQYGIVVVAQPGIRGRTPADGYANSKPEPIPALTGSLPLPVDGFGRNLTYVSELPEGARLVQTYDDTPKPSLWQRIANWFNGKMSETSDQERTP